MAQLIILGLTGLGVLVFGFAALGNLLTYTGHDEDDKPTDHYFLTFKMTQAIAEFIAAGFIAGVGMALAQMVSIFFK